MELKTPMPLGEEKINKSSVTEQLLDIAKDKEFKRRSKPVSKISLARIFKKNTKEKQTQVNSITTISMDIDEIQETRSLSDIIKNLRHLSSQDIRVYISQHKEQVVNICLVLLPLLVLSITLITILTYTRSQPYRITEEFMQLIEQKDISSAYLLTSDAYKAVTTEKQFKQFVDKLYTVDISNRKIKNRRIDNEKKMGQYAYIRYKVSGSYLDLVIYNDTLDWRVHSIQLSSSIE